MDPITDMLNQIKNAEAVAKKEVLIPFSSIKSEIAGILVESGFIADAKKAAKGKKKMLKIVLKYDNGIPGVENFKRISKPGQRIYSKNSDIKKVRGGFGMSIISTPKGLMTNKDAKKNKMGGEVMLEVW